MLTLTFVFTDMLTVLNAVRHQVDLHLHLSVGVRNLAFGAVLVNDAEVRTIIFLRRVQDIFLSTLF